ncbi:hypothetical protein [Collimonas pratensis]|uniref:Transmembrane protein n=1 Tax=Collimonas pratensis TaxID=279113 RepID=A0A127Q697_9BURK|nr:hypothetical protein [Collimonas pratensis]AMP05589.1 hypothetical protein CPter91_3260 [Collimonas pratensis]
MNHPKFLQLDKSQTNLDKPAMPQEHNAMKRLTTLETRFDAVLPTLATRADIQSVKSEIHKASGETHKWMLATVIGLFLGFGGLFLAMSNTLKAAPQSSAQAPVVIQLPATPQQNPNRN